MYVVKCADFWALLRQQLDAGRRSVSKVSRPPHSVLNDVAPLRGQLSNFFDFPRFRRPGDYGRCSTQAAVCMNPIRTQAKLEVANWYRWERSSAAGRFENEA